VLVVVGEVCATNQTCSYRGHFDHMLGHLEIRNGICFDNILIKSPNEIICHVCALMISWAGLSKRELQDLIQEGAKLLVRAASVKLDARVVDQVEEENEY
jgi:hypothetical protein